MPNQVLTASPAAESTSKVMTLIRDYCRAAKTAVRALKASTKVTDLLKAWRSGDLKQRGTIVHPKARYQFHGVGCRFDLGQRVVDVDFGPNGRHDGFDAWRLWQYCESGDVKQRLSLSAIEKGLGALQRMGLIEKPNWEPSPHLFYILVNREK